ncbi:hypothetical protein CP8484711_1140A, partial [Chlamydia psittaci 84-8471/1]
MSLRLVVIA